MRRFFAALLAVLMLAAAGCSKPADNGSKTNENLVKINIGTNPKTLDPRVSTGNPESHVQIALFEGLMRLDKDGRAIPGVAESYTLSEDGLTYTFKIRENAKWSNGDPVTAEDFIWTWKSTLDPLLASEYAYQLYYIKGAEKMNKVPVNKLGADGKEIKGADGKPVARPEAEVKADFEKAAANFGAKAIDSKTLEVKLIAPTPYFLSLTSFHTLYPVHKQSVEAAKDNWFRNADTMVGNGPFKLVSWKDKDKVVVEKNPNYWGKDEVKLEKVEFYLVEDESTATTMFESGELDIVSEGVNKAELERLKKDQKDALKLLPDLSTYFYRFNVTKPPMNNVKVRKALAMAIDRNAIVTNVAKAGEKPAFALTPEGILDVTGDFRTNGGDLFKEDVEQAKKLLAEAGYPDGKDFPKITILYNTSENHKRIAEAIQEMWKQNLNINVELQNQEWAVYLDNQTKLNYQVVRAGWIGDYIDPMTFVDMFVTGGGNNQTGWSNKAYDKLVEKAKNTGDQKVRMEAMHQAEQILTDEMPIMPIYHYVRPLLVSPKVEGWTMPLTSPFNLRDASITK